jgi:hypothetical protein
MPGLLLIIRDFIIYVIISPPTFAGNITDEALPHLRGAYVVKIAGKSIYIQSRWGAAVEAGVGEGA